MSNSSNKPPTDAARPLPDWRQEPPRLDETREIILRLGALESQVGDLCELARPAGKADDEQAIKDVMAAVKRDGPTGFASMRIVKAIVEDLRDTHTNALDLLLEQEAVKQDKLRDERDEAVEGRKLAERMRSRARDDRDLARDERDNLRMKLAQREYERDEARDERDEALGTLRELADTVGTAHNLALQKVPPARTDDEPPF